MTVKSLGSTPAFLSEKKVKKPRGKGVPFKKNNPETGEIDERINRTGVRKFDELRHLTQRLLNELTEVKTGDKQTAMRQLEFMMRTWILSGDFQKQARAVEIGYGKVPDEVNMHTFDIDEFIRSTIDLYTDGQLMRINAGEDKLSIVSEVLHDLKAQQGKRKKSK